MKHAGGSAFIAALLAICLVGGSTGSGAQEAVNSVVVQPAAAPTDRAMPSPSLSDRVAKLASGTPVIVTLDEELSTKTAKVGDQFKVLVLHDILAGDTIVIPNGTVGHGEVTFSTDKGGFGKPGILGIALRCLDLAGQQVKLDGRYREEGKNANGAAAATWFAVGIFAGAVQGRAGVIPKGRELRARTGEDISYVPRASAPSFGRPPTTDAADPAVAEASGVAASDPKTATEEKTP